MKMYSRLKNIIIINLLIFDRVGESYSHTHFSLYIPTLERELQILDEMSL